jgi:pyrophosphatase PpaX
VTYSTILFDFDGTLSPTTVLWLKAFRQTLLDFGQSVSDKIILERCFYHSWVEIARTFNLPPESRLGDKVTARLCSLSEEVRLHSGVEELLLECEKNKIKLGLVSSSPSQFLTAVLTKSKIDRFFQSVVTADHVSNLKPHPEPVLLALTELGAKPEDAIFVGDSAADMIAGRAAKTQTGLFFPEAHHQFYDYEKLLATQPDFVFNSYGKLAEHLRGN